MLVNVLSYLVTDWRSAPLLFFRDPEPALDYARAKAEETGEKWTVFELCGTENVPHASHASMEEGQNKRGRKAP